MKTAFIFLCLSSCLIFISCNPQTETKQKTADSVQLFTDNYQPPVFANSNRAERVKDIAGELHTLIEAHAEERKIPGIAYGIVMDGELIISSATGLLDIANETPAAATSAFRIASMTKSFTAMAIMKLRDEGKLSLDDHAVQYIPEMAKLNYLTSDAPAIRIINLLTMTAGFPEDNPWGDRQLDESDQMLMDLIASGASFSTVTGYQYEYSNTGYALLGNIISRVSGMPYQDYISKNILLPLGMEHTYWEYDNISKDKLVLGYRWEDEQWKNEALLHDGSYGAMGGLITTIEDFSKYVNFHLAAWPPRSDAESGPVKRSTLREMQSPQYSRLYADAKDLNDEPCAAMGGYGYGLSITKFCDGMIQVGHGGALPGFGSNYVFYPEYGLGIMAFGNRTYTGPYPLQKIKKLLFEQVGLEKRQLPISEILVQRQEQVVAIIKNWDTALEAEILAENFYMDKSREHRMAQITEVLAKAGAIEKVNPIKNYNELRGRFEMLAENGVVSVYFTLTPEENPKVQQLVVQLREKEE
jgi:CubicO group peptidase (beta-lactamase class C family)